MVKVNLVTAGLLLALFLLGSVAFAKNSVSLQYTGAKLYTGFELTGRMNIDELRSWDGNIAFGHTKSDTSGRSTTNQLTLAAAHAPDKNQELRPGLTYWTDASNKVSYVGLLMGYTYSWLEEKADTAEELFAVSVDSGLNFFSAEVPGGAVLARRGRRGGDKVRTTQFHPTLEVEKSFFNELLTPSLSYTHYFYSTEPVQIEELLSRLDTRFSSADMVGANSMVGGFIKKAWTAALLFCPLPKTSLRADFSKQQSATDSLWSTSYGLDVAPTFAEHYQGKLGWSHSVQEAKAIDYFSLGATYFF